MEHYFYVRLAVLILLVLTLFSLIAWHPKQVRHYTTSLIFAGLVLLLGVLILAFAEHSYDWATLTADIAVLLLAIGGLGSMYRNVVLYAKKRQQARAQQWLKSLYGHLPVAMCIESKGSIVFSNHQFKTLQQTSGRSNPFSGCSMGQSELTLRTQGGKAQDYLVHTFLLPNLDDDNAQVGYAGVDIHSVRDQQAFLHELSQQRQHQNKPVVNLVVDAIHQALPQGLIYLGRYDRQSGCYHYLTHQSQEKGLTIREDLYLPEYLSEDVHGWVCLSPEQMASIPKNHGLSRYEADQVWMNIIRGEQSNPLGILFIFLPNYQPFSQGFMDFLSILIYQIKLELAHQKDQLRLEQSTTRYRTFIQNSNEAIIDLKIDPAMSMRLDEENQWLFVLAHAQVAQINDRFFNLFDISDGTGISDILSMPSLKHVITYVLQSGTTNSTLETRLVDKKGESKWLQCTIIADIHDEKLYGLWLMIRDITESRTHIDHLEYKTRHDDLTDLPNRLGLHDILDEKIELAKQFGLKVGLVCFDLDRFKEINDALGHTYGDVLLKKIPLRIEHLLKQDNAYLCRLGGDEFAIVMPSIQNLEQVTSFARTVLQEIKQAFDLGQLHVEVSASMGISSFPDHGNDAATLIRCADIAMYKAKHSPGGILSYSADLDEGSPRRLAIMAAMNNGLKQDEFYLCYQPKLNLQQGSINAAEALIRWNHPDMGIISPAEFIPLAEMSDVIIDMTEWVLNQAISQLKDWLKKGIEINLSVNVSTRNLLDENLLPYIEEKLIEHDVPARLLELEITESSLMVDPERALETLNKIADLGVGISVDDFGTGYSSLIYLRQLPITALKIDLAFVRNMCNDPQDAIIVNSIINLGHNLSLTVIAEGAEDQQTLTALKQMGCDFVQGYVISRPVTCAKFEKVLNLS